MWTGSGNICEKDEVFIKYNIHTSSGQGGSPIFYRKNDQIIVIGIHLGSETKNKKKRGLRLKL